MALCGGMWRGAAAPKRKCIGFWRLCRQKPIHFSVSRAKPWTLQSSWACGQGDCEVAFSSGMWRGATAPEGESIWLPSGSGAKLRTLQSSWRRYTPREKYLVPAALPPAPDTGFRSGLQALGKNSSGAVIERTKAAIKRAVCSTSWRSIISLGECI
jgi:hypothetical protein